MSARSDLQALLDGTARAIECKQWLAAHGGRVADLIDAAEATVEGLTGKPWAMVPEQADELAAAVALLVEEQAIVDDPPAVWVVDGSIIDGEVKSLFSSAEEQAREGDA